MGSGNNPFVNMPSPVQANNPFAGMKPPSEKKNLGTNDSNKESEIPLVSLNKSDSNPQLELSQKNFSDYILNPASIIPVKPTISSLDIIEKQQFIDQNGYFKPKPEQDILLGTIIAERDNPVSKYNRGKLFLEQDMATNAKEDKFRDYILSPSSVIDKSVDDLKKDILDEGEPIVDGKIPSISYANARKAQIDKQISDLKLQQNFINTSSGVVRMDLATGEPQKTVDYDELQGKINDLSAYRQQLVNYTEPLAKVQVYKASKLQPAFQNNPTTKNFEVGLNYAKLFDPISVENKRKSIESEGEDLRNKDLVSIENYGYEKQGIVTSVEALDILHSQGQIDKNVYESERGGLLQANNQLLNKYPAVRIQNIKGALGQILDNQRDVENSTLTKVPVVSNTGLLKSLWENIVHAGYSDSEVQGAIEQLNAKGANITKKEAEFLIYNKADIANTALLGRVIGGVANFENKLEATFGIQNDTEYENSKYLIEKRFGNTPNKAIEQPQTLISTEGDIESNPNFMQPVKNPDAGLHNFGWGTVNLVADGVGTLAKLYALTELTGGLADELVGSTVGTEVVGATESVKLGEIVQQTALSAGQRQTIGTIAGMYLDTYQDAKDAAKNFIGDEQGGEPAREMYANLMGLANGIAWTILPANKIVQDITSKAALTGAEDFLKLIPEDGIAGLKENTVASFVTNTLKNTAEAQGKMTGISALTQIGQYTAQAMYNPQSVESRNLGQEVVDGALQGLSFLPITLLEGRGIAKNIETVNDFTKEAIYRVSADPVSFKDYTESQVAKGDMTQQQANAKIELINTMFDIRTKDVPDDLTKQEKVEYANNLLFTRKLQDENKSIKDPVQTKKNDEKIVELEKRRQEILDNSTGKLPTQEAAVAEPIVTETTQPIDAIELLKQARESDKLGVFKDMEDEAALKMIAQQAQSLDTNGKPYEGTDAAERATMALNSTVNQFGKELVDAAIEKYPVPITETKLDVVDPVTEPDITVGEMLDKTGTYNGEKGSFVQDGQAIIFKVEGKNKEYELGNIDEIKNTSIKDFGITHEQSVVSINDEGGIKVRDTDYQNNFSDPLAAINKDVDGNIVSVNLETTDGKKRTFRGNIAEDIAYQINLKEINKNNETRAEFEQHLNEDAQASKQMEDAGLSETIQTGTVENNDQVSREKIEPKYTVESFADRIATGEKMTAPEDLQFYDNNKTKIEDLLKEKKSSENNSQTIKSTQNESQKNINENVGKPGSENSDQQKGNAITSSENEKRQQGQEVVKDAVADNSGAASSQTPTEKVGKFERKARKLAEKIMSAELPSWAKADLPEGTQVQGLDTGKIQKAIADATIKMGQLLDKGVEFGEAVKEAVNDLVDLLGEGMRGKIEEGFGKDYADKISDKNKDEKDVNTIDPELTNMANAINDAHIEGKFGVEALDKVISKLQDTDIKDIYEKVKEKIRKGVINVKNIRERLLTTREGSEQDQAALLYDLAELKGKENGLIKEIISEDNAEKKIELQRQLLDVQNEIQDNALANRFIGRTASNIFRLRQLWVNRGMDVVDMEEQYKASKGIKNLSEDQKKEIKIAHDQMLESRVKMESAKIELEKAKEENAKLKEENEKLKQLKDKAIDQKKADRALKSKDAIDKSNERINKAKENLKSLSNNLSAGFDPRVAIEIGKMAAEKVYQGIVKFDELVKNVYDDIKDILPNWTEADVARHILTTKDKNGNLIPSDTSERYLKSKLLVDDSNASLREKSKAYAMAQKDIALQQFNWQRDRRADILAKRPLKDRLIDFALRWQRFAVLSYPSTVVKLLAVVGHQLLLKPLKFLIQKGISSVLPKSITDKQTIWGNPEWSALGKYYSAFIRNFSLANLKEQFSGIDTKEILYGNGMMYDEWAASKGLLEFPGRSHGYIKSFIKNPEFQFAHEQQLSGAIGKMAEIGNQLKLEGLTDKERADLQKEYDKNDITNEDVMERINKLSLEHGKWAILMNDNKFVEKFQKYTKDNGAIGALIKSELPIVKIPINYVGRSFATKYGLIKAITGSKWYGGNLPSAFELIFKGTKNLTEDQANLLGKTLTIGTMGAAFFALGYMNRKNVKVNDDGSLDFLGMHISKNLIHSPEFESFFSGSETANKFSEEDNKKVSAWLEDFAQSDWDIAKKNPFANLLTYGFLPNVAITLLSKKDSDAKEQKLSTLLAQKIVNMGVPGFVKQPAQWMDTQEPGIHPMSAPVKRSPQGDMLDKFWQTFELAIPGLRKNVPESGDSGFSDEQLKEPHFEMLKEYGINPPKISAIKEYKVEEDEDHPKGQMGEEEGKIFKEERQQLIDDGIKDIYEKGIVLERKDFGKSPVLDLSNKEEVENFLIQNDISKEDFTNQLEGKIKSVVDKANDEAKKIAVPDQKKGLDLKSKVGN